jgi:DNA modification methylase
MSDIKLYLGDCSEIMKSIPDKSVDVVITDPPYGNTCDIKNKSNSRWSKKNGFSDLWIKNEQGAWNIKPSRDVFESMFRISNHQVIWGGNHFDLPPSPCWLIWDKGQRNFSFADAEIAWTSFKSSIRIFEYARAKMNSEHKTHPTQKPLALMKWIIEKYTSAGDTILDPFMGSGTTGVACIQTGRNFIGVEIDEGYFNIAEKRIKDAQVSMAEMTHE